MKTSAFSENKLPTPLSEEQLQEKFKQMRNGSLAARDELIVHNIRLVIYEVQKFSYTGVLLEDLISIGCIGLIKSIDKYDIDRNKKFSTFSTRCIDNEILMFLRKNKDCNKKEVSLESVVSVDKEGETLTLKDILTATDDVEFNYERIEQQQDINQAITKLTEKEAEIVSDYFGFKEEKKTLQEIAEDYHMSRITATKIVKRALDKIESQLKGEKPKVLQKQICNKTNKNS